MLRFIVVVALAAVTLAIAYSKECTGDNEEYYSCTSACARNCSNIDQMFEPCTAVCVSGCFCKPGYLRRDDNECVRAWQCLQTGTKRKTKLQEPEVDEVE